MKEWFLEEDEDGNKKYEIGQIENSEDGITNIYARKVNRDWEYAIVSWHFGSYFHTHTIKDGKVEEK